MYFDEEDSYIDINSLSPKKCKHIIKIFLIRAIQLNRIFYDANTYFPINIGYYKYLNFAYTFSEIVTKYKNNLLTNCFGMHKTSKLIKPYLIEMLNNYFLPNVYQVGLINIIEQTNNKFTFLVKHIENKELYIQTPYISLIGQINKMQMLVNEIADKYSNVINIQYCINVNDPTMYDKSTFNFTNIYPMFTDKNTYSCFMFSIQNIDLNNCKNTDIISYAQLILQNFLFETLVNKIKLINSKN
jgi:hypothetical protein